MACPAPADAWSRRKPPPAGLRGPRAGTGRQPRSSEAAAGRDTGEARGGHGWSLRRHHRHLTTRDRTPAAGATAAPERAAWGPPPPVLTCLGPPRSPSSPAWATRPSTPPWAAVPGPDTTVPNGNGEHAGEGACRSGGRGGSSEVALRPPHGVDGPRRVTPDKDCDRALSGGGPARLLGRPGGLSARRWGARPPPGP